MNAPKDPPKSFLHGYSKLELIAIVTTTLEKAQRMHREARAWRNRCQSAEAELEALKASRARIGE